MAAFPGPICLHLVISRFAGRYPSYTHHTSCADDGPTDTHTGTHLHTRCSFILCTRSFFLSGTHTHTRPTNRHQSPESEPFALVDGELQAILQLRLGRVAWGRVGVEGLSASPNPGGLGGQRSRERIRGFLVLFFFYPQYSRGRRRWLKQVCAEGSLPRVNRGEGGGSIQRWSSAIDGRCGPTTHDTVLPVAVVAVGRDHELQATQAVDRGAVRAYRYRRICVVKQSGIRVDGMPEGPNEVGGRDDGPHVNLKETAHR